MSKKFIVPNEINPEQFEELVIQSCIPAMIFLFAQESEDCREYAEYVSVVAKNDIVPKFNVLSMDDLKFPDFRKKFKIRGDSRFIFFKDGKKFDECMLNRRGAGIIINEMLFVPKK